MIVLDDDYFHVYILRSLRRVRMCTDHYDDLFQSVLYGKKSKRTSIIEYFCVISTVFYIRPTLWRIQRFLKIWVYCMACAAYF